MQTQVQVSRFMPCKSEEREFGVKEGGMLSVLRSRSLKPSPAARQPQARCVRGLQVCKQLADAPTPRAPWGPVWGHLVSTLAKKSEATFRIAEFRSYIRLGDQRKGTFICSCESSSQLGHKFCNYLRER